MSNTLIEGRQAMERAFNKPLGEVIVTDPTTGGQKGTKPEQHALVPVWPQDEVARVYGAGSTKYSPNNWRKGYAWSLSISALFRHINKFRSGESIDPDDGYHHLAHAVFHLNTLMEYDRLGLGTDDRGDTGVLDIVNSDTL